jgi:hypothetical protein
MNQIKQKTFRFRLVSLYRDEVQENVNSFRSSQDGRKSKTKKPYPSRQWVGKQVYHAPMRGFVMNTNTRFLEFLAGVLSKGVWWMP